MSEDHPILYVECWGPEQGPHRFEVASDEQVAQHPIVRAALASANEKTEHYEAARKLLRVTEGMCLETRNNLDTAIARSEKAEARASELAIEAGRASMYLERFREAEEQRDRARALLHVVADAGPFNALAVICDGLAAALADEPPKGGEQ